MGKLIVDNNQKPLFEVLLNTSNEEDFMAELLDSNSTIISPAPIIVPGYTTVRGETITGKDFDDTVSKATESAKEKYTSVNGEFDPSLSSYQERTEFNNDGTYSSTVEITVRKFPEDVKPDIKDPPPVIAETSPSNPSANVVVTPVPNPTPSTAKINTAPIESKPTKPDKDWRFRISLAPSSTYFYNIPVDDLRGTILEPLKRTNGVIFPYTPTISMSYSASYDSHDLVHTNYKFHQYKNSEVGSITISADFTAQDTAEANYVLAMMHFFKSATKMFYGQDSSPPSGLPPPLCFLHGYGPFQFDNHPVVIQAFSYQLPNDVDYIRARTTGTINGVNPTTEQVKPASYNPGIDRLKSSSLNPGGVLSAPAFTPLSNDAATYVPTKLTISLTCLPVMARADVSKNFSLREYAKGSIFPGAKNKSGGGFW